MLPWISKIKASYKIAVAFFAIVAVFVFLFFGSVGFGSSVHAQDVFGTQPINETIVLSSTDIRVIIVRIINVALGLLGIITLGLILYAGFLIMTSGGEENKVTQGKKILIQAVIGLAIILSAFAIVQFVFKMLTGGGQGGVSGEAPPGLLTFSGTGALGEVVKDHYPFVDQIDVARNTSIVITFAIPIEPSSIAYNTNRTCWDTAFTGPTTTCFTKDDNTPVNGSTPLDKIANPYFGDCLEKKNDDPLDWETDCDQINTSTIAFGKKDELNISGKGSSTSPTSSLPAAFLATYQANATTGPELYTIVIKPHVYLGSPIDDIWYSVYLQKGINMKGNAVSIFDGLFSQFYTWNFQTGTTLDLSPPHVVSVNPKDGDADVYKNTILQINFDEAVDPTMVSGFLSATSAFKNILVNNGQKVVEGTWKITNGYKTVEFVTNNPCGQNSCGETMFCLPVDCVDTSDTACTNPYSVLLKTGSWTGNTEALFEATPFSGIYDLAFNGLDNLIDGSNQLSKLSPTDSKIIQAEDKKPDNYYDWNFTVKNEIDRIAPYVERTSPGVDMEDVAEEEPLKIGFSKLMWISTLGIPNMDLNEYPKNICADGTDTCVGDATKLDNIWHATYADQILEKTVATMKHRAFGPNDLDLYYFPTISSKVKSLTQNCMYPGYGPLSADNVELTEFSEMPACEVTYNENGDVVKSEIIGCVPVEMASSTDTGCAYTKNQNSTDDDFVRRDVDACVETLSNNEPGNGNVSPYEYKTE